MSIARSLSRYLLVLAVCLSFTTYAQEAKNDLQWYTDIGQAYELSNKSGKPIFAFFTGSDWCGWCHRLQATVLTKPGFKKWAKDNVILLELDFPRTKKLPDNIAQQNANLQQAFQVRGYPTCWIFTMVKDPREDKFALNPLGQLGYPQSQPGQEEEAFLATANGILKNKKP